MAVLTRKGISGISGLMTPGRKSERLNKGVSMMINGASTIIYSKDPDADRAFQRDVLQVPKRAM